MSDHLDPRSFAFGRCAAQIEAQQESDAEISRDITMPCLEPLKALAAVTNIEAVLYMMDGLNDKVDGFDEQLIFDAWPELDAADKVNKAKMAANRAAHYFADIARTALTQGAKS